jgi:hypothetical protein
MLSRWNPIYILIIGGVLVLAGMILPLLMVMQIIRSTYALNFISYIASFIGLMAGIIGSALYVSNRRRKNKMK